MKIILLHLLLALSVTTLVNLSVFSQNHFPESGNVGIGIEEPDEALEIRGNGSKIKIHNTGSEDSGIIFSSHAGEIGLMAKRGQFSVLSIQRFNNPIAEFQVFNMDYENFILGTAQRQAFQTINAPSETDIIRHFPGLVIRGGTSSLEFGISGEPWIGNGLHSYSVDKGQEPSLRMTNYFKIHPRTNFHYLFDIINFENNDTILHVDQDRSIFYKTVGIGTTIFPVDEKYKLYVKGGIVSEVVRVNIATERGWGDFVFDEHYTLLPLDEIEKYITEHKHLPLIPTAKEIEKDGLDLGEIVRLQMIKIEELTLYILEQNKRIEQQSFDLKKQISDLNEQLQLINKLNESLTR